MRKMFVGTAVLACLVLAGCGDKGGGGEGGQAGGGAAAASPVGHWSLDAADFKAKMKPFFEEQGMPPEMLDQALASIAEMKVEVELKGDNTFTADATTLGPAGMETSHETGTWSLSGDTLTWTVETRDGEAVEGEDETHSGTWSGDTITAHMDEVSPAIVLRRK